MKQSLVLLLVAVFVFACSATPETLPRGDDVSLPSSGDLAAEIGDAGHFDAIAAIEIRETPLGDDVQLMVNGTLGRYGEFAFTMMMPPEKWAEFTAGGAIGDMRTIVTYPLNGAVVMRVIQQFAIEYLPDGTATMRAQLGSASLVDGRAPTGAAPTTTFVARWSPRISCSPLSPDPAMRANGLAGYDPQLVSEFCQRVIREYHLETFTSAALP